MRDYRPNYPRSSLDSCALCIFAAGPGSSGCDALLWGNPLTAQLEFEPIIEITGTAIVRQDAVRISTHILGPSTGKGFGAEHLLVGFDY